MKKIIVAILLGMFTFNVSYGATFSEAGKKKIVRKLLNETRFKNYEVEYLEISFPEITIAYALPLWGWGAALINYAGKGDHDLDEVYVEMEDKKDHRWSLNCHLSTDAIPLDNGKTQYKALLTACKIDSLDQFGPGKIIGQIARTKWVN